MKKHFYLALLAIFLACLPMDLLAQEPSPLVVDPPRLSKTVFINWEPIEVIFTVRYLDGYEPDYSQINNLSFSPFELDQEIGENPKIIRRQKYREENYFDVIYSLRMIDEKKGEIILPAQKFFYIKLEPGKSREKLGIKEYETETIKLRYERVITSKADDIIDRIDFGDFGWQAYFWKALALTGFIFSVSFCWLVAIRYYPARKNKKELTNTSSPTGHPIVELELTPKEAREKLLETLAGLAVVGDEFGKLKENLIRRRKKEVDLYNDLRGFLLSHLSFLNRADTTQEMLQKICKVKSSFQMDIYFNFVSRLSIYEKELYERRTEFFWQSEQRLNEEISYFKQEIKSLSRPWIWWNQLAYRWRSRGRSL